MHLSSFDGNLAYLFTASIQGDSLVDGLFYSGLRTPSNWIGFASEINNLRAPEQITKINAEKAPFDFYLPNQDGDTVSWKNLNLDGKVVIIDFTGSWCPNCIDATAALSLIESELNNDDLVILPIAFELTDNQNIGISRTKRMLQHKLDSKFIYGGQLNKTRLKKLFPMLEDFGAFPTLLFIDKQRQVRRIYTGFYGPGTGEYYQKFLTDSRGLIHTLLQE